MIRVELRFLVVVHQNTPMIMSSNQVAETAHNHLILDRTEEDNNILIHRRRKNCQFVYILGVEGK